MIKDFAKNPKYDGYQNRLASMVYIFFDKKSFASGIKNENMPDQRPSHLAMRQLAKNYTNQLLEIQEKKSAITFYIQNLGCWSSRYTIDNQI